MSFAAWFHSKIVSFTLQADCQRRKEWGRSWSSLSKSAKFIAESRAFDIETYSASATLSVTYFCRHANHVMGVLLSFMTTPDMERIGPPLFAEIGIKDRLKILAFEFNCKVAHWVVLELSRLIVHAAVTCATNVSQYWFEEYGVSLRWILEVSSKCWWCKSKVWLCGVR